MKTETATWLRLAWTEPIMRGVELGCYFDETGQSVLALRRGARTVYLSYSTLAAARRARGRLTHNTRRLRALLN